MGMMVQPARFGGGAPPTYPVTLTVTNPGAETGNTTGWTASATLLSINTTGGGWVGPHSGSRYFSFDTSASGSSAYQDITIPTAQEADVDTGLIAFWLRAWRATDTDDWARWQIIAYDASNVELARMTPPEQKGPNATWVQYSNFLRLPALTRKVRILMEGTVKSGSFLDAYFDDVEAWLDTYSGTITSYANTLGTGNRTGTITTSLTVITAGGGAASGLVDGSQADSFWWNNGTNNGTQWVLFDLGTAKIINQFRWYQDLPRQAHGVWNFEGSNDNSSWTTLEAGFTLMPGMRDVANTTAYRYYRLRAMSGSRSSASYNREIEFKIN